MDRLDLLLEVVSRMGGGDMYMVIYIGPLRNMSSVLG